MSNNNIQDFNPNLTTAKAMRLAGQAVFLIINIFLLYCIVEAILHSRYNSSNKGTHPTLRLLLAIWPLLFIRGLYGVLSSVLPIFNYFNANNYGESSLTVSFVTSEYFLGTLMEWSSCTLLIGTYLTSRNDPKEVHLEMHEEGTAAQFG
jgi:peptidoglycan biosynthesis protein MviN/MurJ (putative lipid II flippase)